MLIPMIPNLKDIIRNTIQELLLRMIIEMRLKSKMELKFKTTGYFLIFLFLPTLLTAQKKSILFTDVTQKAGIDFKYTFGAVSYTHLRAHETRHDIVCRLLL